MSNKVFSKDLPRRCEYCIHGIASEFSDEILCLKKGITHSVPDLKQLFVPACRLHPR